MSSTTAKDKVLPTTAETFDADVLGAAAPVLVDFTATWCPPCRALEPIVHQLAVENEGRLQVRSVNGDEQPGLAARFNVRAFPTLIAFVDGREVRRHVGLTTKKRLLSLLDLE